MAQNKLILRTLTSTGDITKNSVLSHEELDGNFIFLKGRDVVSGVYNDSNGILTFTLSNGNTFDVDLNDLILTGTTNNTLRFNGFGRAVESGVLKNDGTELSATTLNVINNFILVDLANPPSSPSDVTGKIGEVRIDNEFFYIKTNNGWAKQVLNFLW